MILSFLVLKAIFRLIKRIILAFFGINYTGKFAQNRYTTVRGHYRRHWFYGKVWVREHRRRIGR